MKKNAIRIITVTALTAALIPAQSSADDDRRRPGKTPAPVVKTLIFNVSAASYKQTLYRAIVTCDFDRRSKRKMTDSTGTAPISFRVHSPPSRRSVKAECLIFKRGYRPVYQTIDLSRVYSPKMITVALTPAS